MRTLKPLHLSPFPRHRPEEALMQHRKVTQAKAAGTRLRLRVRSLQRRVQWHRKAKRETSIR